MFAIERADSPPAGRQLEMTMRKSFGPEWPLVFGILAKFAADDLLWLSRLGTFSILFGLSSLAVAVLYRGAWRTLRLGATALLLSWLCMRSAAEGNWALVQSLILGMAAYIGAVLLKQLGRPLLIPFVIGSSTLIGLSHLIGTFDPTGVRYQGVFGNPNRLAAVVLLSIPFIVQRFSNATRRLERIALSAVLASAVYQLSLTESSQAIAALGVLVLAFSLTWSYSAHVLGPGVRAVTALLLSAGAAWVMMADITLSDDLRTMSGRTPIFAAAWEEITMNIVLGTGSTHFDMISDAARSTHSVPLSLSLIGGFGAGLLWLGLLLTATLRAARGIQRGVYAASSILVLAVLQNTQTLELMPLTWMLLAMTWDGRDWESKRTTDGE